MYATSDTHAPTNHPPHRITTTLAIAAAIPALVLAASHPTLTVAVALAGIAGAIIGSRRD